MSTTDYANWRKYASIETVERDREGLPVSYRVRWKDGRHAPRDIPADEYGSALNEIWSELRHDWMTEKGYR